jgi:Putative zincin peptidase
MRLFDYKSDPLLAAPSEWGGWRQLHGIGIGVGAGRVITYASILAMLVACLLPFWFDIDPIAELRTVFQAHGTAVVLTFIFLGIVISVPLHEVVHILVHPDHGASDATVVGIYPAMAFTIYSEEMSYSRFLTCLLAPLLVFGAGFLSLCLAFPQVRVILAMFLLFHLLMCVGDVYLALQLLTTRERFKHVLNRGTCLLVK